MKQVWAETVNGVRAAIVRTENGYRGVTWRDGVPSQPLEHEDLNVLKAAMLNEAGRAHPDYFGIDEAIKRFLSFFPAGFSDPQYHAQEREYKVRAREALLTAAPLDRALQADQELAAGCRKGLNTNLLSRFEAARLNEVLASSEGPCFVRAAASFAIEPSQRDLHAMAQAVGPHGRISWPLATYLPYLWSPDIQMFLKPEATRDFAVKVNHSFAHDYEAAIELPVYKSLLDLADWTQRQIASLQPADRIDVQSFIWVVGSYTDADRNHEVTEI